MPYIERTIYISVEELKKVLLDHRGRLLSSNTKWGGNTIGELLQNDLCVQAEDVRYLLTNLAFMYNEIQLTEELYNKII